LKGDPRLEVAEELAKTDHSVEERPFKGRVSRAESATGFSPVVVLAFQLHNY